jgi:hypothetical protein
MEPGDPSCRDACNHGSDAPSQAPVQEERLIKRLKFWSEVAHMAKLKGVQVKAIVAFLKARYGEDAVNDAIAGLPEDLQRIWPQTLLDSSWYPYEILRPIRGISRSLATPGSGDQFSIEMGKFIADYTLGGLYRSVLEKDPLKQVEKFSWVHDLFYEDCQKIETAAVGPKSCVVRYRYQDGVRPARSSCATTLGFWLRTVELSGGADVTGDHPKCVSNNKDCCEFVLTWT